MTVFYIELYLSHLVICNVFASTLISSFYRSYVWASHLYNINTNSNVCNLDIT